MILAASDHDRIEAFWQYCQKHQYFNLGYPESADFDYSDLYRFFDFSINNCGDWKEASNYALNSFEFEKDVMRYFAEYFEIPFEDSWGYVTNGGTEGNLFSCYIARELFPHAILYYSKETHYSVVKIAKLLKMKTCVVSTCDNGEIDVHDLMAKIQANQALQSAEQSPSSQHQEMKSNHPIIFANIGTTMTGAIDNICLIQQRLGELGFNREDYYIHADAALSGMILPFVDHPQAFTFADGIDSICVSGHKMIGSPIPCGVVLAKREHVERISVDVDYISARDQTISGSRNGHSVLLMWAAIRSQTNLQKRQRIQHCLNLAQYAVERFQAHGIQAWRNLNSITVVFPCPSEEVWKKHYLATSGDVAHLITTAHHKDTKKIDALIDDVIEDLQGMTARRA